MDLAMPRGLALCARVDQSDGQVLRKSQSLHACNRWTAKAHSRLFVVDLESSSTVISIR